MNVHVTGGKSTNYDAGLAMIRPEDPLELVAQPDNEYNRNAVYVQTTGAVWAIIGYLKDELVNHWAAAGIKPGDWTAKVVRPTWTGGKRTGALIQLDRKPLGGGLPQESQRGRDLRPGRGPAAPLDQKLDPQAHRDLARPTEGNPGPAGRPDSHVLGGGQDEGLPVGLEPLHGEAHRHPDLVDRLG